MTFPPPPDGRGRHAGPQPGDRGTTPWVAGLPREHGVPRPDQVPGPPAPPRRRAHVIDREHGAHFPIAEYARHTDPEDPGATGPLPPAVGGSPVPPTGEEPADDVSLPPHPTGTWSRLQPRADAAPDEDATVAQSAVGGPAPPPSGTDDGGATAALEPMDHDQHEDEDAGGLDVLVTGDRRRSRRAAAPHGPTDGEPEHDSGDHDEGYHEEGYHDAGDHDAADHDDGEVRPRRRRPLAAVLSLLVLGGLVAGIFFGGSALIGLINPAAEDYAGQGTGSVQVRIQEGNTLSDIARALVDAEVIASIGPFVDAAEEQPAARGIQPGVYEMRQQMSGAAALDLLLDPATRLFSRVTIPEGFTVQAVLERLADETGTPIEELTAVAADPAAVRLPPYADGMLEGWLFPATYDFEPDVAPADMLGRMVARTVQVLDGYGVPEDQRLEVITRASLVQAEANRPDDMARVAQVLENRLSIDMLLQLDSTVNYATGKTGITTTPEDRASPSPYNTYAHPGLPPGAIGNPGEDALQAVLEPAPGDWIFFVTVNPDTGETRFAVTAEEHAQNVELFRQWLRESSD